MKRTEETVLQNQNNPRTEEKSEADRLEQALRTLREYVKELAARAGESETYAETLWEDIWNSSGLLQELAYYHDYGTFLCKYSVAGYTLADALVWQVDHFKLYMDRPEEMNRYRRERLLLSAFASMVQLEKDPAPLRKKMEEESGQDAANG
ncbi:MAG: hypothetical protein NC432_08965 [Roseburia sp.]|nr:hypothetical protein [Roseburia sp.]MCM1099416.1 hypothetical protein [Ruminococcus flavefaciens]